MDENTTKTPPQLGIKVGEQLQEALEDAHQVTGLSKSHIAREALWNYIAELKRTHPAYESVRQAAALAGAQPEAAGAAQV